MVDVAAIDGLRTQLRGALLCPDQDGYDTARTIPNAMIDRRPALIARCTGAADVIACVRFAREHDLVVVIEPAAGREATSVVPPRLFRRGGGA